MATPQEASMMKGSLKSRDDGREKRASERERERKRGWGDGKKMGNLARRRDIYINEWCVCVCEEMIEGSINAGYISSGADVSTVQISERRNFFFDFVFRAKSFNERFDKYLKYII